MSEESYGTSPIKRTRRTQAELAALESALIEIVRAAQPATVRQIFYQAVVKGLVPKSDSLGYKPVQRRLVELRKSGAIPYSWITDNTRYVHRHNRWGDHQEFISDIGELYRRDYWRHSPVRVEVWIEKDALAGVISPVVIEEWGLDLYVSRGFASISYLESAAKQIECFGKPTFVYILTDFDPAGLTIAEKIEQGLAERVHSVPVTVERLAVEPWQIEHWNLPTRPHKDSNAKTKQFEQLYGVKGCAELDALPPDTLRTLVTGAIVQHADTREIAVLKEVEKAERMSLLQKLKRF